MAGGLGGTGQKSAEVVVPAGVCMATNIVLHTPGGHVLIRPADGGVKTDRRRLRRGGCPLAFCRIRRPQSLLGPGRGSASSGGLGVGLSAGRRRARPVRRPQRSRRHRHPGAGRPAAPAGRRPGSEAVFTCRWAAKGPAGMPGRQSRQPRACPRSSPTVSDTTPRPRPQAGSNRPVPAVPGVGPTRRLGIGQGGRRSLRGARSSGTRGGVLGVCRLDPGTGAAGRRRGGPHHRGIHQGRTGNPRSAIPAPRGPSWPARIRPETRAWFATGLRRYRHPMGLGWRTRTRRCSARARGSARISQPDPSAAGRRAHPDRHRRPGRRHHRAAVFESFDRSQTGQNLRARINELVTGTHPGPGPEIALGFRGQIGETVPADAAADLLQAIGSVLGELLGLAGRGEVRVEADKDLDSVDRL